MAPDGPVAALLAERTGPVTSHPTRPVWGAPLDGPEGTMRQVSIVGAGYGGPPEQYHTRSDAVFDVRRGAVTFTLDGTDRTVAAGVRHTFRNEGDETALVVTSIHDPGRLRRSAASHTTTRVTRRIRCNERCSRSDWSATRGSPRARGRCRNWRPTHSLPSLASPAIEGRTPSTCSQPSGSDTSNSPICDSIRRLSVPMIRRDDPANRRHTIATIRTRHGRTLRGATAGKTAALFQRVGGAS